MGTNYYWHKPENTCKHCGRSDGDELHIGKSSAGWCFLMRIHPDEGINDLPDWYDRWNLADSVIKNEYGTTVTANEMLAVVLARFWRNGEKKDPEWLRQNHAVEGPFGLARHADAKHGDGTYDLVDHEFC